jgi:hypothetical protein
VPHKTHQLTVFGIGLELGLGPALLGGHWWPTRCALRAACCVMRAGAGHSLPNSQSPCFVLRIAYYVLAAYTYAVYDNIYMTGTRAQQEGGGGVTGPWLRPLFSDGAGHGAHTSDIQIQNPNAGRGLGRPWRFRARSSVGGGVPIQREEGGELGSSPPIGSPIAGRDSSSGLRSWRAWRVRGAHSAFRCICARPATSRLGTTRECRVRWSS